MFCKYCEIPIRLGELICPGCGCQQQPLNWMTEIPEWPELKAMELSEGSQRKAAEMSEGVNTEEYSEEYSEENPEEDPEENPKEKTDANPKEKTDANPKEKTDANPEEGQEENPIVFQAGKFFKIVKKKLYEGGRLLGREIKKAPMLCGILIGLLVLLLVLNIFLEIKMMELRRTLSGSQTTVKTTYIQPSDEMIRKEDGADYEKTNTGKKMF